MTLRDHAVLMFWAFENGVGGYHGFLRPKFLLSHKDLHTSWNLKRPGEHGVPGAVCLKDRGGVTHTMHGSERPPQGHVTRTAASDRREEMGSGSLFSLPRRLGTGLIGIVEGDRVNRGLRLGRGPATGTGSRSPPL